MSIPHELAKRLKNAKFPHEHSEDCYFSLEEDDVCENIGLSELIEACGDDFDKVGKWKIENEPPWHASGYDHKRNQYYSCLAKTPEEAVANLYLAINENEQ